MARWGFITTHGLVLAAIAGEPQSTARQIGDTAGITERAAHKVINDLDEAGYIDKKKVGRRNHYRIHGDVQIKDRVSEAKIGELLMLLGPNRRRSR